MATVTFPRLLVAAAIGIAYHWVSVLFWGYYAVHNPINEMLLDALARHGQHVEYRVVISIHDVVVNVVLALPFAAALRLIPTLRSWKFVALAAATAVIAGYGSINLEGLPLLLRIWNFWFGLALVSFSLPAACALLNQIRFGATPSSATQDAA